MEQASSQAARCAAFELGWNLQVNTRQEAGIGKWLGSRHYCLFFPIATGNGNGTDLIGSYENKPAS